MLCRFLFIAWLAAPGVSPSVEPAFAARAPLPSVESILARHAAAIGGLDSLGAIHDIVWRGEYREGDQVSPGAALALMRPFYKLVGDPANPSMDFREGYDGSTWEFYGDPGIVLRTVGPAAAAGRHATSIDGPLLGAAARGFRLTLVGIEPIGGRDAWQVRVHMPDDFEQDEFVDVESGLRVAERKVAPIHAYGAKVATEERWGDFRRVGGVLFPFRSNEVEIATGKVLNEMTWTSIEINQGLDPRVFSPPQFDRTPLQVLLDLLYAERADTAAVMWSYRDFRGAWPEVDTDEGMQVIGYQMLKTSDVASALALLTANAADHPGSSGAAFALGRGLEHARLVDRARAEFRRALALDPGNGRARRALEEKPAVR